MHGPTRSRRLLAVTTTALAAAVVAVAAASSQAAQAPSCHPRAKRLSVTFQPVAHSADGTAFAARITLANRDARCALGASRWRLYFNFVRQPLAVLDGPAGDAARQELAGQGLTLQRGDRAQSGDLYVLAPTSSFKPLQPGERRPIALHVELWAILKTDAPAGWHIVFDGEPARWVPANVVIDPSDPKQVTAFAGDHNPVETAATRYAENTATLERLSLRERIVPRPLDAPRRRGTAALAFTTAVQAPHALAGEAASLRSALRDVVRRAPVRRHAVRRIRLRVDPALSVGDAGAAGGEAYRLSIGRRSVRITGAGPAGVLHGIQTLRQLVPASAYAAAARGHAARLVRLPAARIADAPLFGYRGLQIDVARHFESKATIERFLDLMSFFKLNRLHLHLTDDEGWRLQIPGLPELTAFGARRGYDPAERSMLHQGMGSANDLRPGDGIADKPADATEANLGRAPAYQGFEPATLNYKG